MRQWTVREARHLLMRNGYEVKRTCGSHEMWSNGTNTISLPVVKLKGVVMNRLVKENGLEG